jgi:hypothetical protein
MYLMSAVMFAVSIAVAVRSLFAVLRNDRIVKMMAITATSSEPMATIVPTGIVRPS